MNEETATTTGRRTWRLMCTLVLPWGVCGGLLWALVGLTPTPEISGRVAVGQTSGLAAGLALSYGQFGRTADLSVVWNPSGAIGLRQTRALADAWGVFAISGDSPSGRMVAIWLNLLWLLPIPLLWSGVNLWRWVRRGGGR